MDESTQDSIESEPEPPICILPDGEETTDDLEAAIPLRYAAAERVLTGTVDDATLGADGSVGVTWNRSIAGDQALGTGRLTLPAGTPGAQTPWLGAQFLAFLPTDDLASTADLIFFACETAGGVSVVDPDGIVQSDHLLGDLSEAAERMADAGRSIQTIPVGQRVRVLDLQLPDGSRIGVFMPETLGARFNVWLPAIEEGVRQPWPIVFSNETIVGGIGPGTCELPTPFAYCSDPLVMTARLRGTTSAAPPLQMQLLEVPMPVGFGSPSSRNTAAVLGTEVPTGKAPFVFNDADLVVYSRERTIAALDRASLEPIWQFAGAGDSTRLLEVLQSEGIAVVQSDETLEVVAFDASGAVRWRRMAQGPATSEGGAIVERFSVGDSDDTETVVGIDALTGDVLWDAVDVPRPAVVFELSGFLWWSGGGSVARIDRDTGTTLWVAARAGRDRMEITDGIVDFGDAGSFVVETGQRLRDADVSPCC